MMLDAKSEAKKEGLMALIKKMYEMMDSSEKAEFDGEEKEEDEDEKEEMPPMMAKEEGGLMSKAMDKAEDIAKDDLDMNEIKEFLTKKRKTPVGKSINFMAITKVPAKPMDKPKLKKY